MNNDLPMSTATVSRSAACRVLRALSGEPAEGPTRSTLPLVLCQDSAPVRGLVTTLPALRAAVTLGKEGEATADLGVGS